MRQVAAVRLFFTPEEEDDAQNRAKRHFLQTGESRNDKRKTNKQKIYDHIQFPFSPRCLLPHSLASENAKESLALMPLSKPRERLMLRALNRYGTGPDGCAQAWLSLPHSMRVFYLHAYCSRSAANSCTRTQTQHYLLFHGSLGE